MMASLDDGRADAFRIWRQGTATYHAKIKPQHRPIHGLNSFRFRLS